MELELQFRRLESLGWGGGPGCPALRPDHAQHLWDRDTLHWGRWNHSASYLFSTPMIYLLSVLIGPIISLENNCQPSRPSSSDKDLYNVMLDQCNYFQTQSFWEFCSIFFLITKTNFILAQIRLFWQFQTFPDKYDSLDFICKTQHHFTKLLRSYIFSEYFSA